MNLTINALLATLAIFGSQAALANETNQSANTSTVKASESQKSTEKVKDIDDEITDARMRATLGSKSKFSFKSSLAYNGSSIETPLAEIRPNYRASKDLSSLTSLSGDIGMNYRLGQRDNISFGTGITMLTPLHGALDKPTIVDGRNPQKPTERDRWEVSTPYLSWSRGYKAFGTQMSTSVTYAHYTDSYTIDEEKYMGSISASHVFLWSFGASKWTGGTSITLANYLYNGDYTNAQLVAANQAGAYARRSLDYGLFPFAQYTFNDMFSFRTVFGYFQFTQYEGESEGVQLEPYQSVGLGISVTRDIYLYPNVQFTPKDIRSDRTNVALSANINLF